MAEVHSTAIVDPKAELGENVRIGPYAVIGAGVRIGEGSSVGAHCTIEGPTTIGRDNRIYQFASLGSDPQDMKYRGEATELRIGDRNTIREFCTFSRGTVQDGGVTTIGNDNWIMAYVHIAHDCVIGNRTILANNATLAGHVHLGDWVFIGGLTGIHQFVKVGAHAMAGFGSHVSQDIPPFMTAAGNPLAVRGLNVEGLRRRGFSNERIAHLKQMHRLLYRQGLTLEDARQQIANLPGRDADMQSDAETMLGFLAQSTRGIVR
jgi:UDP-N-acetylglucosamine acyltransferase|nr:acyl-ACP--UDP-N-acetylglucosamine O-acyltransferase [uncultured Caldimonas sp.]